MQNKPIYLSRPGPRLSRLARASLPALVALLSLLTPALMVPAGAEDHILIGTYRDWDAYIITPSGGKECYMISMPKRTLPRGARRGKVYMTVTHRPAARVRDEINVIIGYPFRKDSEAQIRVGRQSAPMFTDGDGAWLYDSKAEARLVSAMKKGSKLVVKGTSARGTRTTDSYSLLGFTAAHNAITQACFGK